MDKPQSNIDFQLMSFQFKIRDLLSARMDILKEVGLKPGFHVLDYGCGPGSYIVPTANLVGKTGKVYALDIHPLAIKKIHEVSAKRRLANVETILSDCKTGLPDNSVDAILLYDAFHDLSNPNGLLTELHRVLKGDGILSFSDHHMKDEEVLEKVAGSGLFRLLKKGKRTYSFVKRG